MTQLVPNVIAVEAESPEGAIEAARQADAWNLVWESAGPEIVTAEPRVTLGDGALRYMAYVDDVAPECPIPPELRNAADDYCAELETWLSARALTDTFYLQDQAVADLAPIDAFLALGYLDTGISFGAGEDSPLANAEDISGCDCSEHTRTLVDDLEACVGASAKALNAELQKLLVKYNSGP